jgi:hypothetical protein
MKKFNVGVLGIGDISDVYIKNLKKYGIVNVVACAGRNLQKAEEKATAHAIAKAYATPAELVSDASVDIVLNLTLPAAHAELNIMALEAGKHEKSLPRQTPYPEWTVAPNERRFNETSHRENSRGIGRVDMAYAIRDRRPERASGAMGAHCLEIMESLLASASEGCFCHLKSSCARPEPLAANFPESES